MLLACQLIDICNIHFHFLDGFKVSQMWYPVMSHGNFFQNILFWLWGTIQATIPKKWTDLNYGLQVLAWFAFCLMGQSWKHIYLLLQTLTGLPKPCRQANPKLKFLLPGCTVEQFLLPGCTMQTPLAVEIGVETAEWKCPGGNRVDHLSTY